MRWVQLLFVAGLFCTACTPDADQAISFNRDIRPILNEKCMRCHGGVKASGGFNLLFASTALGPTDAGRSAIVPGNHHQSALYQRLVSEDPEIRMPLEGAALSKEEIALIARWIDEGAQWEKHWAYIPPDSSILPPAVADAGWPKNDLDRFILAGLEQKKLSPNDEAARPELLRRLYFDLTGLPPTAEEAQLFLNDQSPEAYEKLVDQLLTSPHFGERWASMWLDLARYADTKGYEKDSNRSIWKYRDWVINAFNQDMPFDQFTIEQLAGDLLDHPTADQLIATAFHRNTIANDEGGTDDETFRVASVIERVGTTYEVWQATTMACVQCHSHPYDPFLHREFYTSMAYFNNAEDRDIYNEQPKLFTYAPEDTAQVAATIKWIKEHLKPEDRQPTPGFLHEQKEALLYQLGHRVVEAEEYTQSSPLIELLRPDQEMLWQVQDSSWVYFRDVDLENIKKIGFLAASPLNFAGTISVHLDGLNGPEIGSVRVTKTGEWNGWQGNKPGEASLFKEFITELDPVSGRHDLYFRFGIGDTYIQHLFYLDKIIYYEAHPAKAKYDAAFQTKLAELSAIPFQTTPIIRELPADRARSTRIYERGSWLTPGDTVMAGIPGIFAESSTQTPADRLAFARWLVSADNPLSARVIVNRVWAQLFGNGLAPLEDFGTQAHPPTHPELLDWLAVRLRRDQQWHLKTLIKEIVMSATYRQNSDSDPEKLEVDPDNKWHSRGVRSRLTAEQIRDQILAVSDLLDRKIGGPGVILPELGIGKVEIPEWALMPEAGQYRRSLYTFWKRTDPFPDMITFDSPDRAFCSSQRIRTNTPLQALNLLNDENYFEAAMAMAEKMATSHETTRQQIAGAYERLLFKPIDPAKLALLEKLYQQSLEHYQQHAEGLEAILPAKELPVEEKCNLAALGIVANALLNLDELIVKS